MDERAQVSIEYLLTVMFAVTLVIAVTVIALNVTRLADEAQAEVLKNRDTVMATLLG